MRPNPRTLSAPLLLSLLALGCTGNREEAQDRSGPSASDSPLVVASIYPIGDLIQRMAGEGVQVQVVLPPGASPATFDLTPRQLRDFQNARIFFMIGGGLDEWIADLPSASGGSARIVRLSEGIQLLAQGDEGHEAEDRDEAGEALPVEGRDHEAGSGNPHIWLDPILVRDRLLPTMRDALQRIVPQEADGIRQRALLLADSLTALDEEIRSTLADLDHRAFIATHSAWTYFAGRYGMEELGTIHAHPGQEPSSRQLAHLLEVARTRGVQCLFIEPQLGEVAARALAAELDLPTCMLDPLGGPALEGRDGYLQLLRFNARQLKEGLGGSTP